MKDDQPSVYYDPASVSAALAEPQGYRGIVGGMWEKLGHLQLEALKAHGLRPQDSLLDIGCGSLRLGRLAAAYLDPGHYWGTDISEAIMAAGYAGEIEADGLADRLPRSQLVLDGEFAFPGVPQGFRFAIAQSVFTHLPISFLRLCLTRLADHVEPGGQFLFTVFPAPDSHTTQAIQHQGGVTTYPDRDPFHHSTRSIREAGAGLPWEIGEPQPWAHPRGQYLARAVRL